MSASHSPQAPSHPIDLSELPIERHQFKALLLQNSNYFGNLPASELKPVKPQLTNTSFEQLGCVGYNPAKQLLEATIAIKRPFGYGGNACQIGTIEYVRFFIDYGGGWEDAGLTGVRVHDIPNGTDCSGSPTKPLIYVAVLKLDPKTRPCRHPVLPKVRAILSWQWAPPPGPANAGWLPPWGNVVETHIQLQPGFWNLGSIFELINESANLKVKIPSLFEPVKFHPIPLPDPAPLSLIQLTEKYATKAVAHATPVEPHRFGFSQLHPLVAQGAYTAELVASQEAAWKGIGLNLSEALAALEKNQANVSYEQLECLGLDESFERLVASFRIKRPAGYSGDLCHAGSQEYVAFWADWDNTCHWTYLGTVAVNVHDIASIPPDGLTYAAFLPVDLSAHRRGCGNPKIGRVRAVLSWAVPPSSSDPEALQYWGNRLDAHVQILPGEPIDPKNPIAKIRNLGGIPIENIETFSTGLTQAGNVVFAHYPASTADGWGLGRQCPFGGTVQIEGFFYPGFFYRLRVRKVGDISPGIPVDSDFYVERNDIGFDHQVPLSGGWFNYLDPAQEFTRTLGVWPTSGDDKWEVVLEIATAPNEASVVSTSPWYRIQLDNTRPLPLPTTPATLEVHISASGDCKDFNEGDTIHGTFIADDLYFGGWSLSTEPNTVAIPSNQPVADPYLPGTTSAPGPVGHGWTLNTGSPVHMKPCGYVVRLDASDRSIVNSYPGSHNSNSTAVGFCLRKLAP
jgi:hypothetical protein